MAEYIEREPKCGDCIHADLCERVTILKNFNRDNIAHCKGFKASADVVEVVHGRWIESYQPLGFDEVKCAECSSCGEDWIIDEDECIYDYIAHWKYCPNCGAKMDGERRCDE